MVEQTLGDLDPGEVVIKAKHAAVNCKDARAVSGAGNVVNAAGETFTTSIYPFILRSVSLAGINANHPVATRGTAWTRMARGGDLRPKHLDKICFTIPFDRLQAHCDQLMGGGVRGRAVVKIS